MGEAKANPKLAYKMAYGDHVTDGTANVEASRLLRNPKIRAAIDKRIADDPLVASRHQLQRRLTEIALGEDRGSTAYDSEGNRVDRWGSKVSDEVAAAKLLLQTRAELVDRHEVTGKDGGAIKTEQGLSAETIAQIRRDALGIKE